MTRRAGSPPDPPPASPRDEEFLEVAIRLAEDHTAAGHGGPFGALVVSGSGEILAEGWNQVTTAGDPTAHAEIVAIRAAAQHLGHWSLAGSTLYASCEPCPMCFAAACWARVGRIVFAATAADAAAAGFDDQWIHQQLTLPAANRAIPSHRLLPHRASSPFDAWQRNADRVAY